MTERTFKDLVELLCGQSGNPTSYADELIADFPSGGLGRSQLNEVLLSLQLDRMGEGLFQFIFGSEPVDDFSTFCSRVEAFRIRSAIQFGNFKYAYKFLKNKSIEEIKQAFDVGGSSSIERLRRRHDPVAKLCQIEPKETYYLGYIVEKELRQADEKFAALVLNARKSGAINHDIYLDYDHLDVYIATSMREKIDFWNVARFARELQQNDEISELKLRFFDPTQAYCPDRIDKGIVEGLMLKRAKCTIYLAGESDTLGKDSELAATLAQGKTVIAYVPKLEEFEEFRSDYVENVLKEVYPDEEKIDVALKFLRTYWPSGAWEDDRVRTWLQNRDSNDLEDIVQLIYCKAKDLYEKKANMLKDIHPLGLQVNLQTGVANGVLVARTVSECAKLLREVILGKLSFRLEERDGVFAVVETSSGSIHRVVTKDTHLTNSFWNFYLDI